MNEKSIFVGFVFFLSFFCNAHQIQQKTGTNRTKNNALTKFNTEVNTEVLLLSRMKFVSSKLVVPKSLPIKRVLHFRRSTIAGSFASSVVPIYDSWFWRTFWQLANVPNAVALLHCTDQLFSEYYMPVMPLTAADNFEEYESNGAALNLLSNNSSASVLRVGFDTTFPSLSPSSTRLNGDGFPVTENALIATPLRVENLPDARSKAASHPNTVAVAPLSITSINCENAVNTGSIIVGSTISNGVTSTLSYTGGNGAAYTAQTIASSGVTGLTASLVVGNFAVGSGTLTYTITGTPSTTGKASFAINIGGQSCELVLPVTTLISINCLAATHNGTLINGAVSSGTTSVMSYEGGNGGTYTSQTVASTGVTGLTATLAAGTFATGTGTLSYTITGTPATAGTASFAIAIGGQTCTLTRTVLPFSMNCASATNIGILTAATAASGVTSAVSYTGGNGGAYTLQTIASTGVTGLTATLAAGTLATGAGTLNYTITGTPAAGGTASFAITLNGQTCTLTRNVQAPVAPFAISCASATHSGTLTSGSAASGVSTTVPYTGGTGATYAAQTITSTGVEGLTATLATGTLTTGAGTLTFTITGTPSINGTASFAFTINGQICTIVRTVAYAVQNTITLGQNRRHFFVSIYDADVRPYTLQTTAASTSVLDADGTPDTNAVGIPMINNVQGSLNTSGITIRIPVTATSSGTLPSFFSRITVPANLTEDNISRDVVLSWPAQAYTSATRSIVANIAAVGGTLNIKKLDINAGIGNDRLGILLGSFTYPYNNAGNTTTFQIRVVPGIPDRMFGVADNNGSTTSHLFLHQTLTHIDGSEWIPLPLGAERTNLLHAAFHMNILHGLNTSEDWNENTDIRVYGNLFQWGRRPDGHEIVTDRVLRYGTLWRDGNFETRTGTTNVQNDNPTHTLFIAVSSTGSKDWRVNSDNTLWSSEASTNNPCPIGFRVPTVAELQALFAKAITNMRPRVVSGSRANAFTTTPTSSATATLTQVVNRTNQTHTWSSTTDASGVAIYVFFNTSSTDLQSFAGTFASSNALGCAVRCIRAY
jgi:uncharacterized protein (TIGR02145 family)